MELYILDRELNLIGVIDNFISLIWNRRYQLSGDFELYVSSTYENIALLKQDTIICKKGDVEAGYIQFRNLVLDDKGKETLKVTGSFLTNYISKRIIWGTENLNCTTELAMRILVDKNCINPSDIKRKIPLLTLGELKNYTNNINFQNTGDNILERLTDISRTSELGYRVKLDRSNKMLKFEVYKGVDRSVNQTAIAPTIFSRDFENVKSEEYTNDMSDFRNTCLIAGTGEGIARKKTTIGDANIGLDRYEIYVDARDITNTKTVNDTEITIPDSEYIPMLQQRGTEKLEEFKEIKTFESEVNTSGNNVYKVDYDLGDIVTYLDKKWGVQVSTRITEIQEVYEGGKVSIIPTFGTNIPTIIDKLKRM
ncbi:MAG: siphovirus ReqiPepy6 Gp37-like family protein [Clostridium sp.]|uniref:siphovirus ReqiPepy6 Gp37-like family protein n=1 Tax=Clostridium sp. TaxID=1506 RepID=UPI0030624F1B